MGVNSFYDNTRVKFGHNKKQHCLFHNTFFSWSVHLSALLHGCLGCWRNQIRDLCSTKTCLGCCQHTRIWTCLHNSWQGVLITSGMPCSQTAAANATATAETATVAPKVYSYAHLH